MPMEPFFAVFQKNLKGFGAVADGYFLGVGGENGSSRSEKLPIAGFWGE